MKINEENFITILRQRNEKALDYVIDNYLGIIKIILKKHLYNLKDVEGECIDDILLAVWNNIDSFDENKNTFKNWICGIARFKAIDYKRKYLNKLCFVNIEGIDIKVCDNTDKIIEKELDKDIEEMLNYLNEKDKDIFYKLFIEQLDVEQIAKEKQVKRAVIYNRVSRAKKKIKSIFKIEKGGVKYEK